jgi:GH25 family lysozyme M1 (1,4-beta-N-acetylmuramidase)
MALFKRASRSARVPRWKEPFATALAGILTITCAQHASASPRPAVTHPERDWLGSQSAKHETRSRGGTTVIRRAAAQVPGVDVSAWDGTIDWDTAAADGARFAYVKATESTTYASPTFWNQYGGAYYAGIIHAAYHFAIPSASSGAAQADYFLAHGGGWSPDGMTLPGALDMEWNPYSGGDCYGLSQTAMVDWIRSFVNEYHAKKGRWPVIYTGRTWWTLCTGDLGTFAGNDPLWVADYNGSPGSMPYDWTSQTIWQYADSGPLPGDQNLFNGDESDLSTLAYGS